MAFILLGVVSTGWLATGSPVGAAEREGGFTAANERAPTIVTIITPATASVDENQTFAIDVDSVDDVDREGAGLLYSFSGGVDKFSFSIEAISGVVTFSVAPDFEIPRDDGGDNVYDLQVRVTNSLGLTAAQDIAITVNDVNEGGAPTITSLATAAADENQTFGIDVDSVDDVDSEGAGLTYSLSGGADQSLFSINAITGVVTFNAAPDFEIAGDAGGDNVYNIQVTLADSGGQTAVQGIAITVIDVIEGGAPTIISLATASVDENQTFGIDVESVDDVDSEGAGLTYRLTGGADQLQFSIDPNTGVVTFNVAPDFDSPGDVGGDSVYDLQVTVTDSGSRTAVQDIAITVDDSIDDVIEGGAPTITSLATASVDENQSTAINVESVDDVDSEGAGLTYALSGGADQLLFSIDANTGVVTFNATPDFENPGDAGGNNIYDIQVTVTDTGSPTGVQDIAITVNDVNEIGAPTIITPATASVDENQTFAIDVDSVDDVDREGAGLLYSFSGGVDKFLFSIEANSGEVTFSAAPDFENPGDVGGNNVYDLRVRVTDSGSRTAVQDIAITVNDVGEGTNTAPTITSSATASVPENQTAAIDVDSIDDTDTEGSGLTYSLTGTTDDPLFSINASSGVVTFIAAPDFENPGDTGPDNIYDIQVTVTDTGSLTAVQDIAITVTEVIGLSFAKWSKVEIQLLGPDLQGMSNTTNPFQVPVDVEFTGPGGTFLVPAFYDGDGLGGPDGNVWKARFAPNATGTWTYTSQSIDSLLNGATDTFEVIEPTGCAAYTPGGLPEFRCVGRLESVNDHYLKFADGPYWLKGGADEPEDFLAPGQNVGFSSKEAAVDYLAGKGVNSVYLMTQNIEGDGKNVWPWVGSNTDSAQANNEHFDVAKLAQWEQWFDYMQSQGLVIHLVFEDDSGWKGNPPEATGFNRAMYYREIIARFGHYNGLYWNISEEYNENYDDTQVKSFAQMVGDLDAYDHPITVHHQGELSRWEAFLGDSRFGLTSFQKDAPLNAAAAEWFQKVADSGQIIPISFDETSSLGADDRDRTRRIVWSVYAGGANFEMLTRPLNTFTDFARHFEDMTRARAVIESLPFWQMRPSNSLVTSGTGYVFARAGEAYLVYLPGGGNINLDLSSNTNSYSAQWFNPRDGATQDIGPVVGGGDRSFSAPDSNDWTLLLRRSGIASNVAPTVSSQVLETPVNTPLDLTLSFTDPDGPGPYIFTIEELPSQGTLSGSGADLTYTPAGDYAGPDSFRWHVNDGLADSTEVIFSLTVISPGENLAPVANNQDVSTVTDNSIDIQLVHADLDGPGPYTVTILQQPVNGIIAGTDNDRIYTPNSGFVGVDNFTWKVHDGLIDSNEATVSVSIVASSSPTITSPAAALAEANQTFAIDVESSDDANSEGDGLGYSLTGGADQAVFSIDETMGLVRFNTAPAFELPADAGLDNIYNLQVMVTDSSSLTDVQDIAITVTDVVEGAAIVNDSFDRANSPVVGPDWVEVEETGASVAIAANKLYFADTSDVVNRPLVKTVFPLVSNGTLNWDFDFDWTRTGDEATYRFLMQLGDSAVVSDVSQNDGVGVNLIWTNINGAHQSLGYSKAGVNTALAVLSGPGHISLVADLDAQTYSVEVDGSVVGTGLPFDTNVPLDTVRFFTDNLNEQNFSGLTIDSVTIVTPAAGNTPPAAAVG